MKWNIFKFMAENKEANEELGEWMNEQLEKVKKKQEEEKNEVQKKLEERKAAANKLRGMEWKDDDDDDDDGNEPSFFVNRNATLNGAEANKLFSPENFRDRGDYIELVKPIENIRMIEKNCFGFLLAWKDAMIYSQTVMKGGYRDWRVPTMEEMIVIYKIKDVCGINKLDDWFWSSSECDGGLNAWRVSMHAGFTSNGIKTGKYYVRCVR
ncbi:DUF1566 domain-containing protein [bacterium]|nr:DUF1566 domain-containing protein [bacterium]